MSEATPTRPAIVIVEDDPDVLRVLTRLIGTLYRQFEVITAAEGRQALAIVAERRVALMLTDYNMPEMNGLDLTAQVKAVSPNTRIALITAYATPEVERLAQAAGVDYFLSKPFKLDQIEQVVGQALAA